VSAAGAEYEHASELRARTGGRRVGLALGSGSARGLPHIGVIRSLREADVAIGVVAGTSIGAVIGVLYAAGQIERAAA